MPFFFFITIRNTVRRVLTKSISEMSSYQTLSIKFNLEKKKLKIKENNNQPRKKENKGVFCGH